MSLCCLRVTGDEGLCHQGVSCSSGWVAGMPTGVTSGCATASPCNPHPKTASLWKHTRTHTAYTLTYTYTRAVPGRPGQPCSSAGDAFPARGYLTRYFSTWRVINYAPFLNANTNNHHQKLLHNMPLPVPALTGAARLPPPPPTCPKSHRILCLAVPWPHTQEWEGSVPWLHPLEPGSFLGVVSLS